MVNEATSITSGRGVRSNADRAKPSNQAKQGQNRPPRGWGHPLVNRNTCANTSNLGNLGPSKGGNVENAGVNGGVDDRINQIATVVAQMAVMFTQANGIPIPPAMQQLGVDIPHLEVPRLNEHPAGNG